MTLDTQRNFNSGKAWLVVVVAMLCQIVFAFGMMKVPANMPIIIPTLGIDEVGAGNLMNAVGILSLIMCIPAGILMQKLGARKIMLFALCCTCVGNIVGLVAGTNFGMLLFSRAIEGVGYGSQAVSVPQFITEWFPPQKRGLPQGVISTWFAIGSFIILNLAPALPGTAEGSWASSWIASIILFVCVIVLAFFVLKSPGKDCIQIEVKPELDENAPQVGLATGLKSGATWLLMLSFVVFCFINSAYSSYFNTYLTQDFALDMATANGLSSIYSAVCIISGIAAGFILNKIPTTKRPIFLVIINVVLAALGLVMFNLPTVMFAIPFSILFGVFSCMAPPTVMSIAPESAYAPETIPVTMGIISLASNLSGVLGTLVISLFKVGMDSWQACTIPNAIFAVISIIAVIVLLPAMRKKYRQLGMLPA